MNIYIDIYINYFPQELVVKQYNDEQTS